MLELPDVELFKRLVERHCLGRVVSGVVAADPGSLEGASVRFLQQRLTGKDLRSCRRHGKHLFIECDDAGTLAMHFGTNGVLQFVTHTQQDPPYVRLRLDFADGDRLAYVNPRRIGRVRLVDGADAFIAEAGLGPDALDPSFDAATFAASLAGRRQPIKTVLMDQTRMAGIGNIYADEIPFQTRLHPATDAGALNGAATRRLFEAMKSVLQTAIDCGAGAENFTDRLPQNFLLRERRAGGRCPRCGGAIRADKHYCPKCQSEPAK